jgi:hypothetical protein
VLLLREEAARSRRSFKQVVNQALRRGLKAGAPGQAPRRFIAKPHDFGLPKPGLDPDKMNQLAGELGDLAVLGQWRRDERRQ